MKYILVVSFIFITLFSNAQIKNRIKPHSINNFDNNTLLMVIESDGIKSGITALALSYSSGTTKVFSMKDYANIFADSINSNKNIPNTNLYKKYSKSIINYLSTAYSFGETPSDVYVENNTFPFSFPNNKGSLCFVQGGVFDKYSLNTLKLNADERAERIVKSVILPSLINFKPLLNIAEIRYFVLDVGYIAKDFSEESSIGDAEQTSIVISKELLIKYINAEITDNDVFKGALFYNINKNMTGSVRKISIN